MDTTIFDIEVYKHIVFNLSYPFFHIMKYLDRLGLMLLVLIIMSNFSMVYPSDFTGDYVLYVYGSRSCPHCHTLANYLIDKDLKFTWFWIEDEENLNVLKALVRDLNITQGTPTTIVYVDNRPTAIVLGAIVEDSFWKNIIDNPSENLRIYYGDKLIREIPIPSGFTEKYIPKNPASYDDIYSYAKGTTQEDPLEYLPSLILIAVLIGAVILIYLRRR